MSVRFLFAIACLSFVSVAATITPVFAADATLFVDNSVTPSVDPDARATWDDLTDNLCVKAFTGVATAYVQKANGGSGSSGDGPGEVVRGGRPR